LSQPPHLSCEQQFRYHVANLRSVGDALDQIDRVGKEALRRADEAATLTATRLSALLLAAEAEVQLLKIVHEKPVKDADRMRVMDCASQVDRWLIAVDAGCRRQFKWPLLRSLRLLSR
jgi:hypothetical protein